MPGNRLAIRPTVAALLVSLSLSMVALSATFGRATLREDVVTYAEQTGVSTRNGEQR